MKNKFFFYLLPIFLLMSCSHKYTIIPRDGSAVGTGTTSEIDKKIEFVVHGKSFSGTYVYAPMANNGKIYAVADDGDSISCDFIYAAGSWSSSSGLGTCKDEHGNEYDLTIHN